MSIAQRGSATHAGSNAGSLSIAKPTGVVSGDVMLLFVTDNNQSITVSGWTLHAFTVETTNSTYKFSIYYKVAGGSEPASYTVSNGGGAPFLGTIVAFSGVDNVSPLTSANTSYASNQAEPLTTPTATNSITPGRVLYARSARNTAGSAPTPLTFSTAASGVTELDDFGQQGAGTVSYAHAIYAANADFSSGGNKTGIGISCSPTGDDTYQVASTLVLKAAPGGPADMTLSPVTESFAADHRISGTAAMSLAPVDMAFGGTGGDPDGSMAMQLSQVSETFAGNQEPGGTFAATLSHPTLAAAGFVIPTAQLNCTLSSPGFLFAAERRPRGENVIVVEADDRGFRVIDEDPGLISVPVHEISLPALVGSFEMSLNPVNADGIAGMESLGDAAMQLSSVTEAFAAEVVAGTFDMTLGHVTESFDGQIISGDMAMQLSSVSEAFDGQIISGDFAMSLSNASMAFSGGEDIMKYVTDIGNGSSTSFTVTHNAGTKDVLVGVYDNSTNKEVEPEITHTSTTAVTVAFAAAPTTNQYRVVVLWSNT